MIDFFRKYVSVVTLILMGLFLLDLTCTDLGSQTVEG